MRTRRWRLAAARETHTGRASMDDSRPFSHVVVSNILSSSCAIARGAHVGGGVTGGTDRARRGKG
jgi:hypothetical protein